MSIKLDCLEEVGWLVKFQPSCECQFFSPPDWYVLITGEVGRVKMGATMGGLLRPAGTGWPWRCHIVLPGRALLGARCGPDDWDINPWQKFLPKADLQTLYFRDLCSFHLPFHSFFIKSVENNKVHIPALSHKGQRVFCENLQIGVAAMESDAVEGRSHCVTVLLFPLPSRLLFQLFCAGILEFRPIHINTINIVIVEKLHVLRIMWIVKHFVKKISKWAGLDFFFPNDLLHSSAAASSCPDNVTAVRKESCEQSNENMLHLYLHLHNTSYWIAFC